VKLRQNDNFKISGWNSVVKSKHQISKPAFRLWINYNRRNAGRTHAVAQRG